MPLASQIIIVGDTGLLGSALAERLVTRAQDVSVPAASPAVRIASRDLLRSLHAGDDEAVAAIVGAGGDRQAWVYAAGIINPRAAGDALSWVNTGAPVRLLESLERTAMKMRLATDALRLVTFGSALEDRAEIAAANPYMHSKAQLAERFAAHGRLQASARPVGWSHIRLHTLYGRRRPAPFMFLGQMEASLRAATPFAMSTGGQLREYHHADDVAENVLHYLDGSPPSCDTLVLGNGEPVRLADLAARVFAHFNRNELLRIGAVSAQPGEVYQAAMPRSAHVVAERDATAGIIAWLTELGIEKSAP